MKVNELSGAALDWAVAKSEGLMLYKDEILNGVKMEGWHASGYYMDANRWLPLGMLRYSTDWAQGGPIIEREEIAIDYDPDIWNAAMYGEPCYLSGPTPLVAAMRCFVASKLGDEIEIPKELT